MAITITASIITAVIAYAENEKITHMKRLQNIEYRMTLASSKMWVLKTKIEFPNFPPKVGIKCSNKTSMKRKTKI